MNDVSDLDRRDEVPFRLLPVIREAIRGTRHDYTQGPIGRAILLLAVPMVLETLMESLFAVVDVFFVSRLGSDAVATIGLTEAMLTLIYTVALGLGIGVTAMVARRIGEGDPDGAAQTAVQAIGLGVLVAAVLGFFGYRHAADLLTLMGGAPEVVAAGSGYTRIMFAANGTILLIFLINAVFRGAGDAVIAMRVLWIANGLNMLLDPMLIFGIGPFPELGIRGAAVATMIGRGTGVAIQLYALTRLAGRVQVRGRHLRIIPHVMWRLVRLSGTGTFQVFVSTASYIGLVRIVANFGSEAVAGYTIAIRMVIFALLPSWGMSNAAATMVGQALGAGKPDRAARGVWVAGFYNMLFLGVIGALFIAFAPTIVGVFTSDAAPLGWGILCLRVVSTGFLFYAWGMVITQSFNGAGDTWTPTIINLFCFWLFELPVAWLLAIRLGLGPLGVFLALTIAFSLLAVVSAIVFRRGRWKTISI